jgi:cation diffusion facilitator family transporter
MQQYGGAKRVTWLSVAANIALGVVKLVVGYWGRSRALMADGLHSLTDLASDAVVLVGIEIATEPPDASHPYGHHKTASLVSLFIAAAILMFCGLLIADSLRALVGGATTVPHWPTLVTAIGSVIVKEWLFARTRRVAHEARSRMVLANAWHHRTDSVSSIVAAIGIAAALALGESWAFLDAAVGLLLGGYLATEGLKLLIQPVRDLIDTAPEQPIIDDLREHILSVPDATGYHAFRARRVGDMIEVDFHLLVPPDLTVLEGHEIASRVKHEILSRHQEVLSVLIHVEPALPEHQKLRGVAEVPQAADNTVEHQ